MKKATLYSLLISSAVCFGGFEAKAMEEDPWRSITSYLPKKALVDNGLNIASSLLSMFGQDPETKKQKREIRKEKDIVNAIIKHEDSLEKTKQRGEIENTKIITQAGIKNTQIITQAETKQAELRYAYKSEYSFNKEFFSSLGSPLQGMPKDL